MNQGFWKVDQTVVDKLYTSGIAWNLSMQTTHIKIAAHLLLDKAPKNKRFVCPFGMKIGRVGKSKFSFFLFFFFF